MDEDLAKALGLDRPHGALVEGVEAKGPADKAGIQPRDVIVAVDRREVPHVGDQPRMVAGHAPGTRVELTVLHNQQRREVMVTLSALEDEVTAELPQGTASVVPKATSLGISVRDEDGQVVVSQVTPEGPADGKLRGGDVIEEVNQHAVASADDLTTKTRGASPGKPVLFRVKRGSQSLFVAIQPSTSDR